MRRRTLASTVLLLAVAAAPTPAAAGPPSSAGGATAAATCPGLSAYDNAVLIDTPIAYWRLGETGTTTAMDCAGSVGNATYVNGPTTATMPNGDRASKFNGSNQYVNRSDSNLLSVPTTGILTIEAWISPSTLNFPNTGGDEAYVHFLGKGVPAQQEYAGRMHRKDPPNDGRPNRISGYAFNLSNPPTQLGVGSHFEDPVTVNEWIHVTIVINTRATSDLYQIGYTRIYKNGSLQDTDSLEWKRPEGTIEIRPGNGTAPFRIGTRDLDSWFQGAIGKVAIYSRELPAARVKAHCDTMRGRPCS